MIIDQIKTRAKDLHKKIIFTETSDERIVEAARRCEEEGIAEIIMADPANSSLVSEFAAELFELRRAKGLTFEQAEELCRNNPMYFACLLLKNGYADGIVSGAQHTTAETLRPALQILKDNQPDETANLASTFFLMEVPDCEYGANGVFLFADSGLNQNPTSAQLVEISAESAKSFRSLVGEEPNVALLSHSTFGSAKHIDVDKVTEAVKIAKQKYPEINLDGEFQADVALDMRAAELKHANSPVAGRANVLIFPDLDAGNIGYKLVQYLAKAKAYGPIVQGLKYPVNDLSRGCTVEDIIGVTAITAVQSAQ